MGSVCGVLSGIGIGTYTGRERVESGNRFHHILFFFYIPRSCKYGRDMIVPGRTTTVPSDEPLGSEGGLVVVTPREKGETFTVSSCSLFDLEIGSNWKLRSSEDRGHYSPIGYTPCHSFTGKRFPQFVPEYPLDMKGRMVIVLYKRFCVLHSRSQYFISWIL